MGTVLIETSGAALDELVESQFGLKRNVFIQMTYAEGLGLIMHCDVCNVCVGLWDSAYKRWTDDKDGLDRVLLGEEVTCWAKCGSKVKLPTEAEVARFQRRNLRSAVK